MSTVGRVWAAFIFVLLLAAIAAYAFTTPAADPGPGSDPRSEFLAIARELTEGSHPWYGTSQVSELRAQLRAAGLDPSRDVELRIQLSRNLLRLGQTGEAVAEFEAAVTTAQGLGLQLEPDVRVWLGVSYLRHAEVLNCIARHNSDCCIFPFRGGGVHSEPGPARKARDEFLAYLENQPNDLEIVWLLNISTMAIGEFPDGVPERFRIPAAALRSEFDIGRFVDVAPRLGIDALNLCGGAIAEDFDGDGLIDIVTSTSDPSGPMILYRNLGNGRFEDRSAASRIDQQLGGLNCIAGDYDGDGDMDVLVLRGAWLHDDGRIRNSLLRNEGDGTFRDVTQAAGLASPAAPTQTAIFGDFDNDGDLDLFVGNESRPGEGADHPSQLFLNDGRGRFTDVARAAGVTNDRYCKGVATGDFDNDGDLDLYLSNVGPNRLYRNNGDGTFTDVAAAAGVEHPVGRSFAVWFFDFDNDGWLDLFVAAFEATTHDIAADYFGKPHKGVSPRLYRNRGDGTFEDVTTKMGLAHPYLPMGANFGDLDNDGFLDIYLTTGEPDFRTLTPSVMLRNDRGTRFQNVTTSGGFGHLQKGHGVAFADFDHDGDQDIYNQLGGFYPGDKYQNALFENPGHGNRFLHVHLVGTKSNRHGVGARLKIVVETETGSRELHRAVGSVSSFGGSPLRQEIGLGKAVGVLRVEVLWPGTPTAQVVEDVPIDSAVRITEGAVGFEKLDRKPFRFAK